MGVNLAQLLLAFAVLGIQQSITFAEIKGPYRIQSFNFPRYKVGVTSITDQSPAAILLHGRKFILHQPGLSSQNQTVSFEASDWPGHYLRHRGRFLYVDLKDDVASGFENTATFKLHKDLMHPGYFTFEALDQPGHYIRHANSKLRIDQSDNSNLFKADSSFRFLEGPYLMESENVKNHVIGVDQSKNALLKSSFQEGLRVNLVHPGLTGQPSMVSLEAEDRPGFYLRHYGFKVDLENRARPRNPRLFDQDGTFKLCTSGCFVESHVTLEAVNLANHYLRHYESQVVMSAAEDSEIFRRDASYKFINAPSFIESYDYPGYRLQASPGNPKVTFTPQGTQFILVYPGLAGYLGSVSLEATGDQRGSYLTTTNNQDMVISNGQGADQTTFRRQASFYIRDSPWFANTIALESVARTGSYVMRFNLDFRLRAFENVDAFKLSASFIRSQRPPMGQVTELGVSLLQSYNFPNHTFGLRFGTQDAYISTNGKRFNIVSPGLSGQADSVSFLSVDRPNTYLRHYGSVMVAEPRFGPRNPGLFLQDATFLPRRDKWFPGYWGFESTNIRNGFIRHSGYRLMVSVADNTKLFKKDASFRRVEGPYLLQSNNFADLHLGLSPTQEALLTSGGHPWYFVHPGLTYENGSVSVASARRGSSYLRHYSYLLDLEDINRPRNPGLFRQDATFFLRPGFFLPHYLALESVNMADHYIRHENYRLRAARNDGSELFKRDASFRAVQGPFLLESYNFKGYGLAADNKGAIYIGLGGSRVHFTYPGLTGQAGTVSLELTGSPGTYLRHRNYQLHADQLRDSRDKALFRADATWWLREELHFEKTLVLESVNFAGYFLHHENKRMKISAFTDTEQFKRDASFSKVSELRSRAGVTTRGPYILQSHANPKKLVTVAAKPSTDQARRAFLAPEGGSRLYLQTPGLTNQSGTVSLLSADRPNHYLRHHGYRVDLEGLQGARNPHIFDEDATFFYRYREDSSDTVLLEAANLPGYFLSGLGDDLRLSRLNSSRKLKDLASFRFVEGPYYLESLVQPDKRLQVTAGQGQTDKVKLSIQGQPFYLSYPSISGIEETFSVSPANDPRMLLCISARPPLKITILDRYKLEHQGPTRPQALCSYRFNRNINRAGERFFAMENLAYTNHYLATESHDSNVLVVRKSASGGHIAMDEAGFRFIKGPLLLLSHGNQDLALTVGSAVSRKVSLSVNGSSLVLVVPGLTGRPGTGSLQVNGNRSTYLRHYGFLLDAEDRASPRNPGIFDEDATFYIRDDLWFEGTVTLESVNFPGHFLHHTDRRMRISPANTDSQDYRRDASFSAQEINLDVPTPTEPEELVEILPVGGRVGVALGTIFFCILFVALLVSYGKIAEVCCKHRTIIRKEGRYDTGDGFDNPIYMTTPSDFTLMYSPQGGVQMVEGKKPSDLKVDIFPPKTNGHTTQDTVDGEHMAGSDIYMDMGSLTRKPAIKKKQKEAVPNPLYEAEHPYPSLAQQSSVELYIDHQTMDPGAMADSGLPGMSNMAMMSDLVYRDDTLPTYKEHVQGHAETKSDTKDLTERAIASSALSSVPFQEIDYGADATDMYVSPTSAIFDGLRQDGSLYGDERNIMGPAGGGFTSVDLVAPPQGAERTLGTLGEIPSPITEVTPAQGSGETAGSEQAAPGIDNGVDDDIPEIPAPPVPSGAPALPRQPQIPDDENVYSQLPLTKKPSQRDNTTLSPKSSVDDVEDGPPPVPPRMYNQEVVSDIRVKDDDQSAVPATAEITEKRLKINFDDDPDAIYASIEFEAEHPEGSVELIDPPFPLHTPESLLPSAYGTEPFQAELPASASLADISNGVLGPKGEIIPLPTRKHSKNNLLDLLSNVFSSDDENSEKRKKEEKLPISIVNPLYDFEGDVATPLSPEETSADDVPIGVSEVIRHTDSTDEEEEVAYKDLVEGKYSKKASEN